jgi:hypothetical protein
VKEIGRSRGFDKKTMDLFDRNFLDVANPVPWKQRIQGNRLLPKEVVETIFPRNAASYDSPLEPAIAKEIKAVDAAAAEPEAPPTPTLDVAVAAVIQQADAAPASKGPSGATAKELKPLADAVRAAEPGTPEFSAAAQRFATAYFRDRSLTGAAGRTVAAIDYLRALAAQIQLEDQFPPRKLSKAEEDRARKTQGAVLTGRPERMWIGLRDPGGADAPAEIRDIWSRVQGQKEFTPEEMARAVEYRGGIEIPNEPNYPYLSSIGYRPQVLEAMRNTHAALKRAALWTSTSRR